MEIIKHKDKYYLKTETGYREVLATTDTSLMIEGKLWKTTTNSPQPSQQFIEKYIESYNKVEVITDVLVEYELHIEHNGRINNETKMYETLKINPDNTINIKLSKDSWNKEEVIKLCKYAWQVGFNVGCNDELSPSYLTSDNFIETNILKTL